MLKLFVVFTGIALSLKLSKAVCHSKSVSALERYSVYSRIILVPIFAGTVLFYSVSFTTSIGIPCIMGPNLGTDTSALMYPQYANLLP